MDVLETKNIDLFNKVHIFEPVKSHIYEPNISLISLISLMFNYAKSRLIIQANINSLQYETNYVRIVFHSSCFLVNAFWFIRR